MTLKGAVIARNARAALAAGVALLAAVLALPAPARGQVWDFRPRFGNFEGSLALSGLYEKNSHTGTTFERSSADTLFTEWLRLGTGGFIYHPRFILFRGKIGLGLAQEEVSGDVDPAVAGRMETAVLDEYEVRAILLPEHPYNLELFSLRRNPYQRGRTRLGTETDGTTNGAAFQWERRPYAFHLSYQSNSSHASDFARTTDTLSSSAVYFLDWTTFAGGYTHTVSDSAFASTGSGYRSEEYSGDNYLRLFGRRLTLASNLGRIDFNQRRHVTTIDDSRFSWTERLSIELPFNLTTGLNYDHRRDSSSRRGEGDSGPEERTSTSDSWAFIAQHRLYQSLITSYTLNLFSNDTSTGSASGIVHALSGTYLKQIPRGHLTAGVNFSTSSNDQGGSPAILNEPQQAPLFGEITLRRTDVVADSIGVRVKSATTGDWIDLIRDVHYLVLVVANTARILITSLPASVLSGDPAYSYSFSVSYSVLALTTTSEMTTWGGNVGLDLFDRRVNPYASYSTSRQSSSTADPAEARRDMSVTTAGLRLEWLPFSLLLERQGVSSEFNPSTLTRAQLTCRAVISRTTQVQGEALVTNTHHETTPTQSRAFTENYTGVSLNLQQRFPRQYLFLLVGGAWSDTRGLSDRNSLSFNGELSWKYRKLEITASVALSTSTASWAGGNNDSARQFYMLAVKRNFF